MSTVTEVNEDYGLHQNFSNGNPPVPPPETGSDYELQISNMTVIMAIAWLTFFLYVFLRILFKAWRNKQRLEPMHRLSPRSSDSYHQKIH